MGTKHPNECFSVSSNTAQEVVKRSIVHYRMDKTTSRLVKKWRKPVGGVDDNQVEV